MTTTGGTTSTTIASFSRTPTSDQLDKDNDGIGDACDPCPWDPDGDADGDGVCLFQGDGVPAAEPDNCPLVPNDQKNCNHEAETANGKTVLGDACDPVPCAEGYAAALSRCLLA